MEDAIEILSLLICRAGNAGFMKAPVSNTHLALSVIVWLCMYAIAYTGFEYSLALIPALGSSDIYFKRKSFGLVRKG